MTSRSLLEDTFGDKVVRFVIGAFLGAVTYFFWSQWSSDVGDAHVLRTWALWALAGGALAVVFGNRFIEEVVDGGWWTAGWRSGRWWLWWR